MKAAEMTVVVRVEYDPETLAVGRYSFQQLWDAVEPYVPEWHKDEALPALGEAFTALVLKAKNKAD